MRMYEAYKETAADVVFRLRQLADEIENESSNHIASSLSEWWSDTTHGVMDLLQQAEVIRCSEFHRRQS